MFTIIAGVGCYFIYIDIPWLDKTHSFALSAVEILQPILIFAMLFVTFCRVNIHDMHLCKWHFWLLAFQSFSFLLLGIIVLILPSDSMMGVILEGAMICFICPVATAGAVVTHKLGGDASGITTYTILINLLASFLIPIIIPFLHQDQSLSIVTAAVLILGKVFPLLLLPLLMAFLVRQFAPPLHKYFFNHPDISFYLWVVALFLAMAVTTHFIVHTSVSFIEELGIVIAAALSCVIQFGCGWWIGSFYKDKVTAGQALGQKNTVLAIWIGYTFFNPVTSLAGGFYSIFHNVINSIQIYRHDKEKKKTT